MKASVKDKDVIALDAMRNMNLSDVELDALVDKAGMNADDARTGRTSSTRRIVFHFVPRASLQAAGGPLEFGACRADASPVTRMDAGRTLPGRWQARVPDGVSSSLAICAAAGEAVVPRCISGRRIASRWDQSRLGWQGWAR